MRSMLLRIVVLLVVSLTMMGQNPSSAPAGRSPVKKVLVEEDEANPRVAQNEDKEQVDSSSVTNPVQNTTPPQQKKRVHSAPIEHNHTVQPGPATETRAGNPEVAQRPLNRWFQPSLILAGALGVIGLCVLAVVSRQLFEMKQARKQTDALVRSALVQSSALRAAADQTDRLIQQAIEQSNTAAEQARAANMAACAAKTSAERFGQLADFSMENVHRTRQAMQLEQRAWIFVTETRVSDFQVGRPLNIALAVKNTGRTLARNVQIAVQIDPLPKGHAPEPKLDRAETRGTIPPNGTLLIDISRGRNHPEGLTEEGLQAIQRGELVVWVYGTIHYDDVFETRQATMFCYMLQPDGKTFHAADIYNDAT